MDYALLLQWWRPLPCASSFTLSTSLLLPLLLLLLAVSLTICWRRSPICKQKQLPPGSLGWPLLGETLQFALFSTAPIGTPLPFFSSRMKRYGKVFKTHVLGRPTVVSMDPEVTKFLLANDEKLIQGYIPKFFTKILGPTLNLHGAYHHAFRELANLSVSANAVQKLHVDRVQEHFLRCLRSWQHTPSPIVVNAQKQFREWAFTYAVKYYIGLAADDPTALELMEDYFLLITGYSSIPINIPGTTFNKVLKARARINSTLRQLVKSRKLEAREEPKDFLDILLPRTYGDGEYYCGLRVADCLSSLMLGAYENSALLFANIFKFLSENEDVIVELKRENFAIQKAKCYKEKLTWDDYRNMHFTKNVVKETLRIGTITQYIMRESIQDISYKGMVIPKGWMVILNFSMVNLNSDYFPKPLQFDPWRWMDESTHNNSDVLSGFGGGPRRCPGSTLAIFEASVLIHYVVTRFKWKRVHVRDKQSDDVDCLSLPLIRNGLFLEVETLDLNK